MKDILSKYSSNSTRFHMPGHNGVDIDGGLYGVSKYDITELDFSDNLQHPTGVLKELQERIAHIYNAKKSLILTQGATAGIDTALLVAREVAGELYLLGETHKSCLAFASVIGLKVTCISSVDEAVALASQGKWIYVTTPNYYGKTIDISRILDARRLDSAVIVDEAHGAHYVFSDLLPVSNSDKADFSIESLHKTLPVFTGGAVLNINNDKYLDMAELFKNKIHSTSPSYLIMGSIDEAMTLFEAKGKELYAKVKVDVDNFKSGLDTRYSVDDTDDFTRLVIRTANADKVALELENRDIYVELFDENVLVLIVTPFNSDKLETVKRAFSDIKVEHQEAKSKTSVTFEMQKALSRCGKMRFVPLDEAVGKVAESEIAIYPPGVPVVTNGDILTSEVVEYIKSNKHRIVGLIGDTIGVREVCEED